MLVVDEEEELEVLLVAVLKENLILSKLLIHAVVLQIESDFDELFRASVNHSCYFFF